MMDIDTIKAINLERAEAAAAEGLLPYVYFRIEDVGVENHFPFPYIGDHRPDGWELVDTHFADASGLGAPDEPALTVDQLLNLIRARITTHNHDGETVGWAVISAGQFQVYVGEFVMVGGDQTRRLHNALRSFLTP